MSMLTVVGASGPGGEGNEAGFGGFRRAQAAGGERHPESERLVRPRPIPDLDPTCGQPILEQPRDEQAQVRRR
jgi:hypothetical protein